MSLEARIAALEARASRAEDVLNIQNLMADYANAADGGWNRPSHDPDACANLFVENGIWEGKDVARADGREEIRKLFQLYRTGSPFAFHMLGNPKIKIDGDTASGEWHLVLFLTSASGSVLEQPFGDILGTGVYTNRFIRTPQGWRFSHLYCVAAFLEPFKNGWGSAGKFLG